MHNPQIDLITVLGPTATGKTSFAVGLAKTLNAAVISADSRQIYKGMDIGTGKDLSEFKLDQYQVPYYLIDIVEAGAKYSVFEYQRDFKKVYEHLKSQHTLPILCGGTGLYIEAVLKGYQLVNVPVNKELRASLEHKNLHELKSILSQIKTLHNTSDVDTAKRAIRAIEIATYYQNHPEITVDFPKINTIIFGLHFERDVLKQRITYRLKQRLREGMIDEAEALMKKGVPVETLMYYGLEYKFLALFLTKQLSYNQMVEQLNTAIHQFAKRQTTWFRKMERDGFKINWIDGNLGREEQLAMALKIISQPNDERHTSVPRF